MIDPQSSINEIVEHYPAAQRILHARGLDLCCGGSHSLTVAAEAHGVELAPLLAELNALETGGPAAPGGDSADAPPAAAAPPLSGEMTVRDCLRHYPGTRPLFERYGMRGCGGPEGPDEKIGFFADMHSMEVAELVAELAPLTGLTEAEARERLGVPAPQPAATNKGLLRKLFGGGS